MILALSHYRSQYGVGQGLEGCERIANGWWQGTLVRRQIKERAGISPALSIWFLFSSLKETAGTPLGAALVEANQVANRLQRTVRGKPHGLQRLKGGVIRVAQADLDARQQQITPVPIERLGCSH